MTMNQIDAQAFFQCASKSFNQLKAIFVALEHEDAKGRLSDHGSHLVGAGRHIAENMGDLVGCWADEAAEPWREDLETQNKSEAISNAANSVDTSAFVHELCHIKTLINSAERAMWQDGSLASDRELVMDAVYLMQNASNKISDAIAKAERQDRPRAAKCLTGTGPPAR
jgi:hypothetical protein